MSERISVAQMMSVKHVLFDCIDCYEHLRGKIVGWHLGLNIVEIEPLKCTGLYGACGYEYHAVDLRIIKGFD